MEIQQLRYFVVAAEEGNITRAATKLCIAQPALSQSIHRLEQELEVNLFDRKGRRIVLNAVGKGFYKEVVPILEKIDGMKNRLNSLTGKMNNTIKINVLSASRLVTDILIAYKGQNPEVHFFMTQDMDAEDWDIRVTTGLVDKDYQGNEGYVALQEEIFLAAPLGSSFSSRESVALKDFAEASFITFTGGKPFKTLCDSFCHSIGMEPDIVFQGDNPSTVRDLIGAGMGVAFWPEYSWGRLESDNVKLLHISQPLCKRNIVLTKNQQKPFGPVLQDFYRFIVQYIAALKLRDSNF